MREVVIVGAVRTPFGKFGGMLRDFSPVDLGAIVVSEVLSRCDVKPTEVEEVHIGINMPTGNRSIARQVALKAGLPDETNALTVDRACCSSTSAISMCYRAIKLGEADIAIGGGTENMSQVPYFSIEQRWGKRLGDITLVDPLVIKCPYTGVPRAVQAGNEALEHGIGREEQDRWAVRSHELYFKALEQGKLREEIVPIEVPQEKGAAFLMDKDESPRPDTSVAKLSRLATVYGSPTVTAGNAPGLNSGASALLLMAREVAEKKGLTPLATIVSHSFGSGHPQKIASIPAYTAMRALKKAHLTIDQIDLIEINEAFAAMPLVSTRILGDGDPVKVEALRERTNVNGGAIAIGHPTGATGGRLVATICYELRRLGGGLGLVAICGGIGEGEAFVLRVGR